MTDKKPIHLIAKELGFDTKKVIKACAQIGIYAKGASKRLDPNEEKKIITYFNSGQNVSYEVIDIEINSSNQLKSKKSYPNKPTNNKYFPNRLIK